MWETMDNYCERVGSGLWAEPLNALSNLAFLVAAYYAWRLLGATPHRTLSDRYLIAVLALIGVGSGLFHTFATRWAELMDIIPIVVFQVSYLVLYCRNVVKLGWLGAAAASVGFVVLLGAGFYFASLGVQASWLGGISFNGSEMYLGALIGVYVLGFYHWKTSPVFPSVLLIAALLFTLSLTLRTLDMMLCPHLSIGTHFLWHLCNATVLYLFMHGYLISR